MARRGIFAELNRLAKQSARERERQRKASHRAYASALRESELARKREQQAFIRAQKASEAELKRLEKEAKESHQAAMAAEVECRNLELAEMEEELAGILAATLGVDDFVDLTTLRVQAEHPPFSRSDLMVPTPPPIPIVDSPKPKYEEPPARRGLLSFFMKGLEQKAKAAAVEAYQKKMESWQAEVTRNEELRTLGKISYEEKESIRIATLEKEQSRYAGECACREEEAACRNREVDELISNLGYGTSEAIEEYIGIVLSNSIYPEHFPINHDYSFDPSAAELRLAVAVISPEQISTVKGYKYVKASDEIVEVPFSSKACKDRYAEAIHQVALRVPHEIFEADRRGLIGSISLELGTHGIDPATGHSMFIPFVALSVARETFMKIQLDNIQPAATLAHLGASMSKNAYGLSPAKVSGIRRL